MSEIFSESFGGSGLIEQLNPSVRVVGPDEVLADQPRPLAEVGCDLVKVLAARGTVDLRRQFVSYNGGDHATSLEGWPRRNIEGIPRGEESEAGSRYGQKRKAGSFRSTAISRLS